METLIEVIWGSDPNSKYRDIALTARLEYWLMKSVLLRFLILKRMVGRIEK